jgi:hypothetical protein
MGSPPVPAEPWDEGSQPEYLRTPTASESKLSKLDPTSGSARSASRPFGVGIFRLTAYQPVGITVTN